MYVSLCTCREYRPIPHLDTYEDADLDHEEYEALSPGARAEVERRLRKRDRQEALASGRMRPGLLYDASEDDEISAPLARRRRPAGEETQEGMEFEEVSHASLNMVPLIINFNKLWQICMHSF